MLYVFSINRVKLVARKSETTNNMGQREYTQAKALGKILAVCSCSLQQIN